MKFKIILLLKGPKGSIYTLLEENSAISEFEKALIEYHDLKGEQKYNDLRAYLLAMCNSFGFSQDRFRYENLKGIEGLYALNKTKDYRFYLYHNSTQQILLTGGGIKQVKLYQQSGKLNFVAKYVISISKLLWENRELTLAGLCENEVIIEVDWTGAIVNTDDILEEMERKNGKRD